MNKNVSRIVVVAAVLAALLSVFNLAAAQTYPPTNPALPIPELRGSTFEPDPATANTGALGFESVNPTPSAPFPVEVPTGGTGGGLAVTGNDVELPVAIGVALLALGGTVAVAARKRHDA